MRDRWMDSKEPNKVASVGLEFRIQNADCEWKQSRFTCRQGLQSLVPHGSRKCPLDSNCVPLLFDEVVVDFFFRACSPKQKDLELVPTATICGACF